MLQLRRVAAAAATGVRCAHATAAVHARRSPVTAASTPRPRFERQLPGRVSPRLTVPEDIPYPPYAITGQAPKNYPSPTIHDAAGQLRMRKAGAVAAEVLDFACKAVVPGMTTDDVDKIVHAKCLELRVYPSPLNYSGFPKSVCSSINEVVCHGIPNTGAVINPGDIVKLDVSCYLGGVHGDTCRSLIAGGDGVGDAGALKLVRVTKECLNAAIAACGPGVPISIVGRTIHPILEANGFDPIREFAGHGIGATFHTEPIVYHHRNTGSTILKPGMTFTIEPMVAEGNAALVMWPDGWTVVTQDGSRAAQFEHTLLVTEHGVDVLTAYE